jgi:hypothetical protein
LATLGNPLAHEQAAGLVSMNGGAFTLAARL